MKNNLAYLMYNSSNSRLTARHRRRPAGASVLFRNVSIAASLALLAFVPVALAQDNDTWVGNTDDTWGTGVNWTFSSGTATAVASGDSLFFGVAGSSGAALNNNLSGFSFSGITFNSGASAYAFSGNSFGLAGGITNNSTSAEIISNNITLSGTKFLSANGNLTLGGVISGSGFGINKTGTNTLILSGANTYGGATTLFAGGLDINNPSALGTGALIIGGSTTIDNTSGGSISNSQNNAQNWNGNFTFAGTTNLNLGTGAVTLGTSPTLTVGSPTQTTATLTVGGPIGGASGISPTLYGNLTLNGNNTYTGGLDVTANGGTLTMNGTHTPGQTASFWILQGNGTININGTENIGGTCFLRTGTLAVPGGATNTVNLSGTLTYAGSGGIILAQNVATNTSYWNILSGGDFEYNATTANGSFDVGNGQASNFGVMSMYPGSIFNINTAPSGTVFGVGRDGGNGIFNLDGGRFTTAVPIVLSIVYAPVPGKGVFNFNGGTLRAGLSTNSFMFGGAANVLAGGAIIDDGGFAITITTPLLTGGVGNDGGLQKLDTGSLTLTGTNTYTGATTINNGVLALGGSGSLADTRAIAIAGGAVFNVSGLTSTFTLGAAQTLSNSTSTAVLNGNLHTGSGTVSLTYGSGTPSLAVTNGTLTLAADTVLTINNTGAALTPGIYPIITNATVGTAGLVAGTVPTSFTVSGGGLAAGTTNWLQINGGTFDLIVDGAPVANAAAYTHPAGAALKISITNLLAIYTTSGGPFPLTLAGVNATSVNGVNITTDANYIYYNYTGASVAPDSFHYTVSDGYLSATNIINVTVASLSATGPSISSPSENGNGNPTFSGNGIPGYVYGVESETSLNGPWTEAGNVTVGATGSWSFTDPNKVNPPMIFYRLYYPDNPGNPPH